MSVAPVVELKNVHKEYRLGGPGAPAVAAVRGVDLTVSSGELVALVGPSGSGKTTLLNLIGCMDVPTSGSVRIAGQQTDGMKESGLTALRREALGFVFQAFNLIPSLTVGQNIEVPLLMRGSTTAAQRTTRVEEALASVGLAGFSKRRPGELSGGQRQRVAIARALVGRPRLVLADEPTANLDSENGRGVLELMRALNKQDGTTFLVATHDPLAMSHASRIVRIRDGAIDPERAA